MDYAKNNRMLSLLGQRNTYGTVLCDLAGEDGRIFALTGDLTRSSGLDRFAERHPDRFLNAGIAEGNAVGVAAGLADWGFIPFLSTFANFAALRANEFVRHFMAYMGCNVKLVGLGGGFGTGAGGTTHYGLEDVAALRALPNLTILSPADCLEVAKCLEFCVAHAGPVYLRLTGAANNPIVNRADYPFEAGRAVKLREGADLLIYATGSMVSPALKAAAELEARGLGASVVNVHTLKPIDAAFIRENKDFPLILTVEEHSRIGGLGSAVAEVLAAEGPHGRLAVLGTEDCYKKAGSYAYMLEQHGLTAAAIVEAVEKNLQGR